MRNLRNTARAYVGYQDEVFLPLTAACWDTSTDSLICAFGPSENDASIELRRTSGLDADDVGQHKSIAEWEVQRANPNLAYNKILTLHYFADTAVICLVLAGGDLVLVRECPLPGEELLEIVGSVDAGIQAAAWSPDEELLVLVTGDDKVLFTSREFESISETKFSPEDTKLSKHVNVGWGKKETQFLGKRARALKDPTMPEHVDEGLLSKSDDGQVRITWRGDSEYVAINVVEGGVRRLMRVYSREGIVDSVSEPVDYFEGPLSWRPSGNIIAGIKRPGEGEAQVIFFERNGLRHGEFKLRVTEDELLKSGGVQELSWNVDSTVLAIVFPDYVQLWTMGNYHYYLKQEIRLPQEQKVLGLRWHPEKPLSLSIFGTAGVYMLDYAFVVSKGSTCSPHDQGMVAVIDGRSLKITPLRTANIPPPMALHELQVPEPILDVAIDSSLSSIFVLTTQAVVTFDSAFSHDKINEPKSRRLLPANENGLLPIQISTSNRGPVLLMYDTKDAISHIWALPDQEKDWNCAFNLGNSDVRCVGKSIDGGTLWASTASGHVSGWDTPDTPPRPIAQLPKFCPIIEVVTVGDEEIVFGLTQSGNLYSNQLLLVANCTSFLVTSDHLIFTTSHHLLQFIHLTTVENLEVPPPEPETDERCRSIERGARLVTVMPSAHAVVLQMPRGNLETIYPRALVLANIRKSIEQKRYKKAFMACRAQRVDMNILHDHAPAQFMSCVGLFLDQLKKVEYIDLFLSQLRDEDVSQTMYKETSRKTQHAPNVIGTEQVEKDSVAEEMMPESKTNRICNALLKELESRRSTNLQNIVTANVCKSPPDLEGGLSVVSKLRDEGEEVAEKGVEHICFLADVNQLYDTALGMYDLELALLIAQQSQKDPKEYIPYLQSLQEMETLRRRFTINNDLGKHKKAMATLHEMDAFDEMKLYAAKHELYSTAIELCKYMPEKLNALMKLYAEFLVNRNRFMEAGIAFEFLGDYASAWPAFKQAQRWREALSCATLVPVSDSDLVSLARSLAEGLTESKDYQSAAVIYLDYLSDVAESARQLCKAYQFADAMRIIGLRRQPELLESIMDAGLAEGFNATIELLADCKSQLQAQVPRLRELRLKKERDPLAFYTGGAGQGEAGADIPDNVSLAPTDATTSAGTFMTRYTAHTNGTLNTQTTRRTSKNRRREERKRARGKKGSVYEEEYLINSIGRLIDRVNSTGEEVTRLVEGLVRRGMRERAVAVENSMADIVRSCEVVIPEVWETKEKKNAAENDEKEAKGADGVFQDMIEGGGRREPPIVKKFEILSLIA